MTDNLFTDFEAISAKQWKQKIQADLKGADYNDTLLWHADNAITVKPFYTKEDRTNRPINFTEAGFNICQTIFIDNPIIANNLAIDALKRGANALELKADKPFDYTTVFANIDIAKHPIYFNFNFIDADFVIELNQYTKSNTCFFNIDSIGHLASTGNWPINLTDNYKALKLINTSVSNTIGVNLSIYQNAGASIVQQLAYTLAHANEYLTIFGKDCAKNIHFNFSVGSNYFFEIAKLRAFRVLWSALLNEYNTKAIAHIFTQPTLRNKTLYDYNVNMLRTTSECMSAILGGTTTISNVAYDEIFHKSNEFGERISRNQLLILQQESYLGNAQNVADGAYYIESLTETLAEKALDVFKQIEQGGGFLKQLKDGIIQKKITESAQKEQALFDKGDLVLLGTNKIQNKDDKMKDNLELFPFLKTRSEKTLIQPIIQKRLSEALEQERLNNE